MPMRKCPQYKAKDSPVWQPEGLFRRMAAWTWKTPLLLRSKDATLAPLCTIRAYGERKEGKPYTLQLRDRSNRTNEFVAIEVGYSCVCVCASRRGCAIMSFSCSW